VPELPSSVETVEVTSDDQKLFSTRITSPSLSPASVSDHVPEFQVLTMADLEAAVTEGSPGVPADLIPVVSTQVVVPDVHTLPASIFNSPAEKGDTGNLSDGHLPRNLKGSRIPRSRKRI
jgi:hypothetical protein